jgi:drug/metabolite transporter, DME family
LLGKSWWYQGSVPERCGFRCRFTKMATFRGQRYIPAMQPRVPSAARATLFIVVSAVSFGSISVLTVLITAAGVSLLTAMAWRYLLAGIALFSIVGASQLRALPKRRLCLIVAIGGFGQALITYLSLRALDYIAVGPLAFLFYTYPAWVALIAAIRGTERLTPIRVIALVLALIGITAMLGTPTSQKLNPTGVMLAIVSAILYSMYLPSLERLQQGVSAAVCAFLIAGGAAAAFIVTAIFSHEVYVPTAPAIWSDIVLLALVSTVIAFFTLIKGLSVLGPVRTAIIATIEPFFTVVLGVLVLANQLTSATIFGGVSIASAVWLIHWSSWRLESTAVA